MFDLETILKYFDIILLGLLVIVMFFVFKRVLGKKTGYQKPKEEQYQIEIHPTDPVINNQSAGDIAPKADYPVGSLAYNVEIIKSKDNNFNENKFISSAKKAFELIVNGFSTGNIGEIKPFVSDKIYNYYENLSNNSNALFDSSAFKIKEFLFVSMSDVAINNDIATIKVKFVTQQIRSSENLTQTFSEYWYFSKNINDNTSIWKVNKIAGV